MNGIECKKTDENGKNENEIEIEARNQRTVRDA